MVQQRAPVQINQFVGGFITEANPLSFPIGASVDEQNMVINRDGSRSRRLGFDVEEATVKQNIGITRDETKEMARSQYLWTSPGGNSGKQLMVVQIGNYLGIHDLDSDVLTSGLIYSKEFNDSYYDTIFSYASVNGLLVITTSKRNITLLTYNEDGEIEEDEFRLTVRDFWGVEARYNGDDLVEGSNLQVRPPNYNGKHIYNLRNQTYALPRVTDDDDSISVIDPITSFLNRGDGTYPSNADNISPFFYNNPNADPGKLVERYQARNHFLTKPPNTPAPRGYFIIDLMRRGASREDEVAKLRNNNPELSVSANVISDTTRGGASIVAGYAGRFWYSGFYGELVDGDNRSPSLNSYVVFSQLVNSAGDAGKCYQAADPTSVEDPTLVDTDGGTIRLDGANNIKAMEVLGSSLIVLAENGVWEIVGLDRDSFTATGYSVVRISNEGCVSKNSVVLANNKIFFWGATGIYSVGQDETSGAYAVVNVSEARISEYYNSELTPQARTSAVGYYDTVNDSVRWIHSNDPFDATSTNELIWDTKFQVFTKNSIKHEGTNISGISSVAGGQSSQFSGGQAPVTVDGDPVLVDGVAVTYESTSQIRSPYNLFYTIIKSTDPIRYTFGGYVNESFYDFEKEGYATDSPAFLTTGPITAQEPRTRKGIPYLTLFSFVTEEAGEALKSSCLFRSKWDWTTAEDSHRWTSVREAYRRPRLEDSITILSTRNKVRGHGKAVSFSFESQPGKNMHLYGWSFDLVGNNQE